MNPKTIEQPRILNPTPRKRTRWIWALSLLLLVAAALSWWFLKPAPSLYRGWLTGLIPSGKGSLIVAYNPLTNEEHDILSLPAVTSDNYGVVSPDGKYAAYTTWNNTQSLRFLNIQSLDAKQNPQPPTSYFKDVKDKFEAKYLTWYPDSTHLAFVNNTVNMYSNESISTLNIQTGELQKNVTGGLWNIPSNNADPNAPLPGKRIESQTQLDALVQQFGLSTLPIKKAATILYVKLSSPSVSTDGKQIAYSATLFRNFALNEDTTWIGSAIYIVDTQGGNTRMVYTSDKSSAIGAVTWINNGNKLAFLRYHEMNGGDGEIDTIDLNSKQMKTLVPVTQDHFVNLNPIGLPDDQLSFVTVKNGGTDKDAIRMIVNTDTGAMHPEDVKMHNQSIFWRFTSNN